MTSTPLTKEQRRKASIDLSLTYLNSYYADWRLVKVLTIKKLLGDRHGFYNDIISEVKQWDDPEGGATIAQEIHNGLYFDAIAHCVQYLEDLFALIKAAKQPDYFIRNIVTYKAGEVTNFLKSFKPTAKSVAEAFHFPHDLPFTSEDVRKGFDQGVDNLVALTGDLIKFYKDYEFFYNQYKHGLAVAMRPFGNVLSSELVEQDRKGEFEPYLAVYDNMNLHAASKKGTFRVAHGVFMPGFTDNVRPFIPQLHNENNFLRLVHPPDIPDFSIDILIDQARKAKTCLHVFIVNYAREIQPEGDRRSFDLPCEYKSNTYYSCSYNTNE